MNNYKVLDMGNIVVGGDTNNGKKIAIVGVSTDDLAPMSSTIE